MDGKAPIKIRSPLYPAGISITIQDVQRHRRLYNYFIQYWRHNKRSLGFAPPVHDILSYVPCLCFVPCFLLAYTCCRVGELKQISLDDILKNNALIIKSSKSKHIRSIKPFEPWNPHLLSSINPDTMMIVVSYDHLKNSIRQAKKRANVPPIDNILDLTHIFRHLTATFLHNRGDDISSIGEKLGHLNIDTTKQYIH